MRALVGLLLAAFASSAHADRLCHTVAVPTAVPNWSSTVVVPSFSPAMGMLVSVRVTLTTGSFTTLQLESLDPQPSFINIGMVSDVSLARPNFTTLASTNVAAAPIYTLTGFDGTIDFRGTSGVTAPNINLSGTTAITLDSASDLSLFTGPMVGTSTVGLPIFASFAGAVLGGPPNVVLALATTTGATIEVCYDFVPHVIDQVCHSGSLPTAPTNWQSAISIPKFDPALGQLQSVEFSLTSPMPATIGIEQPMPMPVTVQSSFAISLSLVRPDLSPIASLSSNGNFVDNLAPYDGTVDFAGPSGVLHTLNTSPNTMVSLTSASDLALFTGPAGAPGTLGLSASANGFSQAVGPGPIIVLGQLAAGLSWTVCYRYLPVAVPFCFGDGSGTACPCANESAVGDRAGCRNSSGTGARMSGIGNASLANDTLVLTCSGMSPTAVALIFQGALLANAGAGVAFGDGLRCAGGFTVRLAIKTAAAGVVVYPQGAEAAVSVKGAVGSNVPRVYQAWYRDSVAFCTPATFNLSSAVAVAWNP